jgi:hypothetical protein
MGCFGVAVESRSLAAGNQLRVTIVVDKSKFSVQVVVKILSRHA